MPTITAATKSIYDRMIASWDEGDAASTFDGEAFDPNGSPYVRLSVRHSLRTQRSIAEEGLRRFRSQGRIIVQCFAAANAGRNALDVLANLVVGIFEGALFDGVCTYAATPIEATADDPRYAAMNISIPFDYDEIR